MKKTVYIDKKPADLVKALADKRESLRKLRFGVSGSKTRDVSEITVIKSDIARILTELHKTEVAK